jgi:hypothetical protein
MQTLREAGNSNAFVSNTVLTKEIWDGVQSVYAKTLSTCFLTEQIFKKPKVAFIYLEMMEEMMECEPRATPLHLNLILKITAWHDKGSAALQQKMQ